MRILVVTSYYKPAFIYGGPARSVPVLAEALAAMGHDVSVYTTDANGAGSLDVVPGTPVSVDGVKVRYFRRRKILPGRFFFAPGLGRACRSTMADYEILYVCATWTYPFLPAVRWARRAGIPFVISPRGSFMTWALGRKRSKKLLYSRLMERSAIERAGAIHCTSPLEADQTRACGFSPPIALIPNGIDLDRFREPRVRGALRTEWGIPENASVSLFVGRLHAEKRPIRMIEAFAEVARAVPGAWLSIVGPDEDGSGAQARRRAEQLGLAGRTVFAGPLSGDRLSQAYADADLLLLLSHRENFGMAVIEGIAAGLPVLLSRDVGVGQEVIEMGAGCVVDAETPELESTWAGMLRDPNGLSAMGEAGRAAVAGRFSSIAVAGRMTTLFEDVIRRAKAEAFFGGSALMRPGS